MPRKRMMMYDLMGDIHGHATELVNLLETMGYRQEAGVYRHPERQMLFAGDFIDRGPQIREVLELVRPMVESGAAQAVMGNHEFNAIAYHTEDPFHPGEYVRPRIEKNLRQHAETVRQVPDLEDYLDWFRTLPMWLEFEGLRLVHACWDETLMAVIQAALELHGGVTDAFMVAAHDRESALFQAIDDVLKGKEIPLPVGGEFTDKDGNVRRKMRIRWFELPRESTYASYALSSEQGFPGTPLPVETLGQVVPYPGDAVPVFFGHYWLRAERPARLAPNVACLDFSVAKQGQLCAYRWNGEAVLDDGGFVSVPAES